MTDDLFDLRFAEVPYELMILWEYVNLLEHQMPTFVEKEKARIWTELGPDDEEIGRHLEAQIEDGVTTRFLTSAALIAVWAVYETTVKRVGREIRDRKEIRLKMSDLRAQGGFLEQARKYFDDVLRFELHPIETDWHQLTMIASIRHALAHANGRLADLKDVSQQEKIRSWSETNSGLTMVPGVDEYLILSLDFVKESLQFIDGLLTDLIGRAKEEF